MKRSIDMKVTYGQKTAYCRKEEVVMKIISDTPNKSRFAQQSTANKS